MLHPNQFRVNEAWIAFRVNEDPIRTEADGDFNCVALMDAASCFILTTALVPCEQAEPTQLEARRLLKRAWSHKQEFPSQLIVASGHFPKILSAEAARQNIAVLRVSEDQLLPFIGEVREGFAERFGHGAGGEA
jgi:hypothetical protein